MNQPLFWPTPGVATGIGPMPGTDARDQTTVVAGELAEFPHIVELPARGPGADRIGRTAVKLSEVDRSFEVETSPSGWRLGHGGRHDRRAATTWWSDDLEALEECVGAEQVPIKIQVAGPWTLTAHITDIAGEALLRDAGAGTDIAAALAEAVGNLIVVVRRSCSGATIVIEVDEDEAPAVLDGRVRTSSGRNSHRHIELAEYERNLATVLRAITESEAVPAVRCHSARPPVDLFRSAGAQAIAVDLGRELPLDDGLPRAWEDGVGLMLASIPIHQDIGSWSDTQLSQQVRTFMSESGFGHVRANVAITPRHGLARVAPETARDVLAACRRVGEIIRDDHPAVTHG